MGETDNTGDAKQEATEYVDLSHTFFDRFSKSDVDCSCRFKRPTTQMANRAQKRMLKTPLSAFKDMCMETVHPEDRQKLREAGETYPGLYSTFGNELLKSIGFGELGNE